MHTSFRTPAASARIFYQLADAWQPGLRRPTRFIEKMKMNWGLIGEFTPYGLDESGLERRNPLIVAKMCIRDSPGICSGLSAAKRSAMTSPVCFSYSAVISALVISRVQGISP